MPPIVIEDAADGLHTNFVVKIPLITKPTATQAVVNGIRSPGMKELAGALCSWGVG